MPSVWIMVWLFEWFRYVWRTFKVILGGGRMYMTPKGTPDPEYPTSNSRKGDRKDKRNLIDLWLKAKPVRLFNMKILFTTSYKDKQSQIHVSTHLSSRTRGRTMFGTERTLMRLMLKLLTGLWVGMRTCQHTSSLLYMKHTDTVHMRDKT